MSKVRVYEVARELGVENRDLIQRIATLGIQVRNHMSVLDPVEVDRIKRSLGKDRSEAMVEERIRPTVVRRKRRKKSEAEEAVAESPAPAPVAAPMPEPVAPRTRICTRTGSHARSGTRGDRARAHGASRRGAARARAGTRTTSCGGTAARRRPIQATGRARGAGTLRARCVAAGRHASRQGEGAKCHTAFRRGASSHRRRARSTA